MSSRTRALLACAAPLILIVLAGTGSGASGDFPESTCVSCHETEEEEELSRSVPEWRDSVHARHEVSCDACHGGDPNEEDADVSMSEEAGFLDNPSWTEMADFCGVCHEVLAERYKSGFFGQMLREGVRVPTCDTCHMTDGHRILVARPEEILSAEQCSSCADFENPGDLLLILREVRERERAVKRSIEAVSDKGMNLIDLETGMANLHARYSEAVHEFDAVTILAAAQFSATQLDALEEAADAYDVQADQRRRYGVALLAALGVLLAVLLRYWKTLR